MNRFTRSVARSLFAALAGTGSAVAADYPVHPVKWVVPYPPDGYTMLLVNPANGINATLYKNLPFDFIRDIAPVAGLVRVPYKGAGPALADPIAGQVHVIFDNLPSSIGFIEGNKIRALSDPKMLERLAELGGKPIKGTPEDFGRVIAAETAKWEKVVKSSGAKVE